MENWLSLNDYAHKHDISVSTLRRHIKANKIDFKLDDGKYFIGDNGQPETTILQPVMDSPRAPLLSQLKREITAATAPPQAADALVMTKLLLEELKKSYFETLSSKEDQILYLKQQVSDLKTLVMLLEKENMKLSNEVKEF